MQSRICAHLRHPTEAYRVDMGPDYSHPHTRGHGNRRIDETEIDLCVWLESVGREIPRGLMRIAGGGVALRDNECSRCQCFTPVKIDLPSSRDQDSSPEKE